MWSKISNVLKPREGGDSDPDHADAQSPASCSPPDPFRVNAAAYYTHQTPPTPPSGVHSRTASREEDIIWSLRTQLALQQELCAQFEIDLGARDELVAALTTRLEASEKENDKRKSVIYSWRKKAADLEKACRYLEEEVDSSRRESMERSIMDEASGEALRQLHRQISQLEREKSEAEAKLNAMVQTVEDSKAELTKRRDTTDESDVQVAVHQISQLQHEKNSVERERNTLTQALENAEAEIAKLQGELGTADEAKTATLQQLYSQVSHLEQVEAERDNLAQSMRSMTADVLRLQEELSITTEASREAQDRLRDQLSQLQQEKCDVERERDNFSSDVSGLRTRIQQLRKDSAIMEVTIVQLNRQVDQDKEDINGLNIALESKQQELEMVKRKHGSRGAVGLTAGRANVAPPIPGKLAVQPSKVVRTSDVPPVRTSPVPSGAPSVLGRGANMRPPPAATLRRASSSSVESKTRPSGRRASIAGVSSDADDKENASTSVPFKNPRRMIVPA